MGVRTETHHSVLLFVRAHLALHGVEEHLFRGVDPHIVARFLVWWELARGAEWDGGGLTLCAQRGCLGCGWLIGEMDRHGSD